MTPHDEGTRGRPAIGLPGRAATELRHGLPTAPYGRPDLALVEREGNGWSLLGASGRGVKHKFRGGPRQDAFGVATAGEALVVVVADGVGEFERSHEAADEAVALTCAGLARGEEVEVVVKTVNDHLAVLADDGAGPLATTLLVAVVEVPGPGVFTVELAWVGDPYAWALTDGEFVCLNTAELAEPDDGVHSTLAAALPAEAPALQRRSLTVAAHGLFFMTDGVGRPMESISTVRDTLARWWATEPTVFEFAAQVEFARRSHMDDRTVVGVWPTCTDVAEEEAGE